MFSPYFYQLEGKCVLWNWAITMKHIKYIKNIFKSPEHTITIKTLVLVVMERYLLFQSPTCFCLHSDCLSHPSLFYSCFAPNTGEIRQWRHICLHKPHCHWWVSFNIGSNKNVITANVVFRETFCYLPITLDEFLLPFALVSSLSLSLFCC